jgi:imidazolonepropionase-like amidohydrolase/ABC-type transport system involved in cytochrome c biogenesis permease component
MNAYLAQIRMNLLLTRRDRTALFFQFLFPLLFFFIFGATMRAEQGGAAATQVVNMVLTIGVLGSGFFGAGIRAVADREQNILRRFKVAPIGPGPILVSSLVTGLVAFLPLVVLVILLAHTLYGMPYPEQLGSLLLFIAIGVVAFRAMGSVIAAVANSMQESQILIQLLYFPMLFLGGATIPLAIMPNWLQTSSQFVPSTYLTSGLQGLLRGREGLGDNLQAIGALLLTTVVATFLGVKLFRWEKEEKLKPGAKLWLVVVLAPFFAVGAWQSHGKDSLAKNKRDFRDLARSRTWLIRDARLFLGDGTVIDQGSVLIKDGKIAGIFNGPAPDPKSLKAEPIEGAGKTLLPGLIDAHVHLGAPGGFSDQQQDYAKTQDNMDRELAAYLYSGVIAVKSAGDALDAVVASRAKVASAEKIGAELFLVGPMFTTAGGHGTEYLKYVPESARTAIEQQVVRLPQNSDEARTQVSELKQRGVDGIKTILEAGGGSAHFNRLDTAVFQAIVEAARKNGLPVVSHTGDAHDVADAVAAHVDGIEHGSFRDAIPDTVFAQMKESGIAYDPTLTVVDALRAFAKGDSSVLDRSLLQQTAPPELLLGTKKLLGSGGLAEMRAAYANFPMSLEDGKKNLMSAQRAGVMLVAGTDAGNPLVFHGPGIHREMQLWVEAGVPAAVALQAATYNNARLLRVDNRIGLIKKGYEASLLLIDGNPLQDISATEHISMVLFKGERIDRSELFNQK